jgi:signal transduction histidine kinase/CheY-like chemotaxis protein
VGGWMMDFKTREVKWTQQTYAIVEAPEDYIPTFEEGINLFPGDAKDQLVEALNLAGTEGKNINIELPFVTMKGRHIWVQVYGEVIFSDTGSKEVPLRVMGAFQDISQRKEHELALQKAMAVAESASRAKGEFLANMSHEIRTPLNAIVGIAYILKGTPLNDEQVDLISKLEGAGRNLIELISDILDLSKIDAGKYESDEHEFTIYELFDSLSSIAAGYQVKTGVDVVFAPAANVPAAIVGDCTKIKQVLVNLLGNALKFTHKGFVQVSCELIETTDNDCLLEFVVEDSGMGMDKNAMANLFESFSQGDSSISRKYGGTGIGLALSQKLVGKMGGKIQVQSIEGKGSRFSFQLAFPTVTSDLPNDESLTDVHLLLVGIPETLCKALVQFALRYNLHYSTLPAMSDEDFPAELINLELSGKRVIAFLTSDSNLSQTQLDLHSPELSGGPEAVFWIKISHSHLDALSEHSDGSQNYTLLKMPVTPSAFYKGVKFSLQSRGNAQYVAVHEDQDAANSLDGIRLLAVDDSKLNLKILRKILLNFGAEVYTAEDGQQALEILLSHPDEIDICLMDVQMPVMDGLEACRRIRNDLGLVDLPVLALTAGAMLGEHQNALKAGMNGVLTKPLEVDKLVKAIRTWVTRRAMEE